MFNMAQGLGTEAVNPTAYQHLTNELIILCIVWLMCCKDHMSDYFLTS